MILALLQARVSSTRLPGKVLMPILGKPILLLEIERIQRSHAIDKLIVATSTGKEDDGIVEMCSNAGVECFRGSLNDVLDRCYQAALPYKPDHVMRLTGDCPLIDPEVIDATIDFYLQGAYDYVSNALASEETFPDGLDTEIFSRAALTTAWQEAVLPSHREHVTQFIIKNPERFRLGYYKSFEDLSHLRWTVDEPEDFELIKKIYEKLYPNYPAFVMKDVLHLLDKQPELLEINSQIARNAGLKKALQADKTFLKKTGI